MTNEEIDKIRKDLEAKVFEAVNNLNDFMSTAGFEIEKDGVYVQVEVNHDL